VVGGPAKAELLYASETLSFGLDSHSRYYSSHQCSRGMTGKRGSVRFRLPDSARQGHWSWWDLQVVVCFAATALSDCRQRPLQGHSQPIGDWAGKSWATLDIWVMNSWWPLNPSPIGVSE